MNIKKYLKSILGAFIIMICGIFLVSILNYFSIFNKTILGIIKLMLTLFSLFYSGYTLGKSTNKMGYIEGLKSGGIIVFIMIIYNIILKNQFNLKSVFFYIILIAISVLGGMIGISRKRGKN